MKMNWRKSSEAMIQKFSELVPSDARVERRKMFGYPAAFAGSNLFMSLFQESLILRLPDELRAGFVASTGASTFEPMPGRLMREYVVVPEGLLADPLTLRTWADRALEYAVSLPSKKRKPTPKKKTPPKKIPRATKKRAR